MTQKDLEKIQEIDTEMLLYVDEVCKKHNIEYCMMYGTLLGAVRHGGPIPWDDDVDIAMTRDNYERFLDIIKRELDPRYELHIMGTDGKKNMSEIKIGLRGSRLYLPEAKDLDVMYQINLDVFLLDYIKTTPRKLRSCSKVVPIIRVLKLPWDEKRLLFRAIERSDHRGKGLYKAALACSHLLYLLFGEAFFENRLYDLYVDESKKSGKVAVINDPNPRAWDEKDFFPMTTCQYSGYSFMAPADPDAVLKVRYGDYMELPPEENRYRKNFDRYIFELNEG